MFKLLNRFLLVMAIAAAFVLAPATAQANGACVTEQTHQIVLLSLGGYLLPVVETTTTTCCSDGGQITCTVVTSYSFGSY